MLWTIDGQFHLIASAEEINEAIKHVVSIRIRRTGRGVELVPGKAKTIAKVTGADVEKAMVTYRSQASGMIERFTAQGQK